MESVYLLELSQFDKSGVFVAYKTEIYSSLKKVDFEIEQSIKINQGFDIQVLDKMKEHDEKIVRSVEGLLATEFGQLQRFYRFPTADCIRRCFVLLKQGIQH